MRKADLSTSHHRFTPSNFRVSCTPTPLITSLFFFLWCLEASDEKLTREKVLFDEKLIEESADSRLVGGGT
jgi:hypothetical protein